MPWSSQHLSWLKDTGRVLHTADGKDVSIFEFAHSPDPRILSKWAKHFRNHYCFDNKIDDLRRGTGLSRCDYLTNLKFPHVRERPGPSVRAGDFGEILVADFVQYMLNYTVPRTRYLDKIRRNQSPEGIDVIGFLQADPKPSPQDELITFEVKCALASASTTTLQRAVNDSCKDFNLRKAESLNAIKQRLMMQSEENAGMIAVVERFQNKTDRPYNEISGAAAVHSEHTYSDEVVTSADAGSHPNQENLFLVLIRGNELMALVHELYRTAANEA